jgi:asparagine synthase (glutamine-hydrolysing)
MCSILALYQKQSVDDSILQKFNQSLKLSKHRGPDDSKIVSINSNLIFGFNRLAIQDLSTSSMQPFNFRKNWLVFNGEIYNFLELKKELQAKGLVFMTTGDTEVLSTGLSFYGLKFLKKLNGMFALIFYDNNSKKLILARDGIGIKPLYYFQDGQKLLVASEIKNILEFTPTKLNTKVLENSLGLDFLFGYDSKNTFFENIYQIQNGEYKIFDLKSSKFKDSKFFYKRNFETKYTDTTQISKKYSQTVNKIINWKPSQMLKLVLPFLAGQTQLRFYAWELKKSYKKKIK